MTFTFPIRNEGTHWGLEGLGVLLLAACACNSDSAPEPDWEVVSSDLPGTLLSEWGSSDNDVWAVGSNAKDGTGPLVFHIQNGIPTRVATGQSSGDLWWVHGFDEGPIFMGGSGGTILRYENGEFTTETTPGTGTIFGMWGTSPGTM